MSASVAPSVSSPYVHPDRAWNVGAFLGGPGAGEVRRLQLCHCIQLRVRVPQRGETDLQVRQTDVDAETRRAKLRETKGRVEERRSDKAEAADFNGRDPLRAARRSTALMLRVLRDPGASAPRRLQRRGLRVTVPAETPPSGLTDSPDSAV